jgi:TrmH family RNA methyltransferase
MSGQLTKRQIKQIKSLYTRQGRKKYNSFIAEGLRCCEDAYALAPQLIELAVCSESFNEQEQFTNISFTVIPESQFHSISGTSTSQGVLFLMGRPELSSLKPVSPFVLILDQLQDPGNVGTILRTARSIGVKDIWYTSGGIDFFNEKAIRAGMASQLAMNLRAFPTLEDIKNELATFGYHTIYRTTPHDGVNCFSEPKLFEKSGIILGNEANGARELEGSKNLIIPMLGDMESLNVAQAATIILFEYVRRQTISS